ncbi:recombination protein RecT [Cupriavidus sp. EM10]|uniref:recombination protein RecT n=1 Tax=Cupriavidus sp. EM10 TaxID=2839983 RepID=UPI001C006E0B|nr:recombination protein RecT [Cupriavidus sp. EM10]QWE95630.1 recombination protein RecT [Cupriavidus sp. EM10]
MSNTVSLADLKKTSKMVASQAGIGSVKTFFESQKATLAAVLPKHVSPDRMLKIALGALRTTPKLMECTVESLMGAVVQCSQLGLEPNTPLGHAYLIPFEKKKKQGERWVVDKIETQIVIGYKGLIDLARRSGQVVSIAAHAVHENDRFEYSYGLDEKLEHKPAMTNRGRVIAFYAVAKLVGGGHAFEVMSAEQVNEIRDASQNYKFARDKGKTVWGQHYEEMGRKTVLRRLFKYLPVSIEMANASTLDGMHARGESQALDNVLEGDYITPAADDDYSDDDAPPALDNQPTGEVIEFDANGFTARMDACEDTDTLDLMAEDIRQAPEQHRAALEDRYRARRAELTD